MHTKMNHHLSVAWCPGLTPLHHYLLFCLSLFSLSCSHSASPSPSLSLSIVLEATLNPHVAHASRYVTVCNTEDIVSRYISEKFSGKLQINFYFMKQ